MTAAAHQFRVAASGNVTVDIDPDELFVDWRKMIDAAVAARHVVDTSFRAFCEWADDRIFDEVVDRAVESVWFEIERGPSIAGLLTADRFVVLMTEGDATAADLGPQPSKGQLDIFGGEHP